MRALLTPVFCLAALTLCSGEPVASSASASRANGTSHSMALEEGGCHGHHGPPLRYPVSYVDVCHVQIPLTVACWLILACVAEIVFHLSKRVAEHFPDSALLIVLGLLVGLILKYSGVSTDLFHLDSGVFFIYLLPPVVFEAGYFMPARSFFDNIGTILCFAVLGTLFNTACIGLSLWGLSFTGLFAFVQPSGVPIGVLGFLLFASLISAVDPVAVLVVFEEIHVNEVLFIVIFGESLLNDAVSVVLYKVFGTFESMATLVTIDYFAGILSFFVVALGGVGIGVFCGVIACLMTRFTKHVRVLEPLIVLMMAYLSYLLAELFHLSGILAIAFCGMTMREYMQTNISHKSQTTVKYFLKMLSRSSEGIMFMFLGLSAVAARHNWNTAFVLFTLLFCLLFRALGVVIQTFFVNKLRIKKLSFLDQFIMAYSGLRGAIAYGLVEALDADVIGHKTKDAFLTCTIIVIMFTVFVQGTTIKPLVNLLHISKDEEEHKAMYRTIFADTLDHILSGVESVCNIHGHNWWREKFNTINRKYINKALMVVPPSSSDSNIIETYQKLSYAHALNTVKYATHMESSATLANVNGRHAVSPMPEPKPSRVRFDTSEMGETAAPVKFFVAEKALEKEPEKHEVEEDEPISVLSTTTTE